MCIMYDFYVMTISFMVALHFWKIKLLIAIHNIYFQNFYLPKL